MMRVGEPGGRQIGPRDFWRSVWWGLGIVALLLVGMGLYDRQTGHLPHVPTWYWAATLPLFAGRLLWGLARRGRRAFPPSQVMIYLGYILMAGGNLVPRWGWAGDVGDLLMGIGSLLMVGAGVALWKEYSRPAASGPTPPTVGSDRA